MRLKRGKKRGFTLIELLVVIAVIALLMAIIMPALGKAKLYAQKIVCRNNIRQQCLGTILYADDHDTRVPTRNVGYWLWDLAFWCTNQVSNYAGFDNNEVYYCPANKIKQADDARFWQFTWSFSFGVPLDEGPVPLRDEDDPSCNQYAEYRVMPTLYFFHKDSLPDTLESGKDAHWIDKMANIKAAAATLMMMDNVISESDEINFFEITAGGVGDNFNTVDNSNHRSNQQFPGTSYYIPSGANVGFADGHVDWRDFEYMQVQINSGPVKFWW